AALGGRHRDPSRDGAARRNPDTLLGCVRDGRDPLWRPGDPAAGAHALDPEAARGDRRTADRVACHPDLRRPGAARLRAAHGLSRRDDRGVRGRDGLAGGGLGALPGHRARHPDGRADPPSGRPPGGPALPRDLRRRGGRHRPRRAAGVPREPRRRRHDDRRTARAAVRHRRPRGRPRARLPGEAALRALGQRRLLRLRDRGARRDRPRPRARAGAARGARVGRPAARVPPRGLLGLHGHLQGRGAPQRPVGGRRPAVEGVGSGGLARGRPV
ncbi:MAG: Glucose-1-phosphate cytidylyltransferase, partial [uncultured Solirubrobacteraceae bacterium]